MTKNFSLHELLASQTATRRGYAEQFKPPATVKANLKYLAENLLEPLRAYYGKPLKITSGYRCARLNEAVGGVMTSQHLTGQAVDLDMGSTVANKALFNAVLKSGLVFDQLINEYSFAWVHLSLKRKGNRKQVLNVK